MSESIGDFEPSAPGDDVTDETTTAPVEFDPFSRAYFDGPDEIYETTWPGAVREVDAAMAKVA